MGSLLKGKGNAQGFGLFMSLKAYSYGRKEIALLSKHSQDTGPGLQGTLVISMTHNAHMATRKPLISVELSFDIFYCLPL